MKKYIISLFFLSLVNFAIGQSKKIKVLYETEAMCDQTTDIDRVQNRIVSQSYKKDTFEVNIGMVVSCSGISDIRAEFNQDTINLYFDEGQIEYDTIIKKGKKMIRSFISKANCDCCFEFNFKALNVPQNPKFITVKKELLIYYSDKYRTYPIKYDIVGTDTLNFIDSYGFKQGKWNKINNVKNLSVMDSLDKYEFEGLYKNDEEQISDLKIYYPSGQLKFWHNKTNIDKETTISYYENGKIKFESKNYGSKLGSVTQHFYQDGAIRRTYVSTNNTFVEQCFYEDGNIKKISSFQFHKRYYPNKNLKYEMINSENKDNIWSKYYYENGKIMSISYIKKSKKNIGQSTHWQTYFDLKGNKVSEEYLIKKGFKETLECELKNDF